MLPRTTRRSCIRLRGFESPEDDEEVKALAGEAYMKEITEKKITVVEAQLSKLADTVLKDCRRRQTQSELEKAARDLFHVELNEGEGAIVDEEHDVRI